MKPKHIEPKYEILTISGYKYGNCRFCGKWAHRKKIFNRSVRQLNVTDPAMARLEALMEITAARKVWMSKPVYHLMCETGKRKKKDK